MPDITTTDVNKIDAEAVTGLLGTNDSLAYKVHELESHHHGWERYFGPAAIPSGEDHVADPLGEVGGSPGGVQTSFQAISGASNAWGTPVQIFGATDAAVVLPVGSQAKYDVHHMRFTDVQTDKLEWLICIIVGDSAVAGIAAGTFTVKPFFVEKTDKNDASLELMIKRATAGDKAWVQVLNVTNASALTIDMQFGVHGYAG